MAAVRQVKFIFTLQAKYEPITIGGKK